MGKDSNWGYMPYLTPDQKQMLAELRKRVDAELPKLDWLAKDTELLRFCRARKFNPVKTWTMLKEDVEWREPFEGYVYVRNRDFGGAYAMHEEGAIRLAGRAKDGRPVLMAQARYYWPKLIEDNIQIVYFFQFYVDAICKMAAEVGQETFYAIADLEGFSMANFSLPQLKLAISILQNHYPERLGMIFVINAPFVFTAAWRLIQPLLDDRTRHKIDILGSNYIDVLTEHISLDQIEKQWGGTHEKFPIPDPIVQVAIDNEKKLLEAQKAPIQSAPSIPVVETSVVVAESVPPSPVRPASTAERTPDVTGSSRKTLGVRRSVRRLVKNMLFTTEKRAMANSAGIDPDIVDTEPPKRMTSLKQISASSPATKLNKSVSNAVMVNGEEEGEVDPVTDFERELFEVKVAHDKILIKVDALEKSLVVEKKLASKARASLQKQVIFLAIMLFLVMSALIRDRYYRAAVVAE